MGERGEKFEYVISGGCICGRGKDFNSVFGLERFLLKLNQTL